jgi:nitroreductase
MIEPIPNPRIPEVDIDAMFLDRWSPRSFLSEPLRSDQVLALFEAARWAPSASNDQPWIFIYAVSEEDRRRFAATLVEWNQRWARSAPLLGYVLARRNLAGKDRPNRTALFDTGAAWMSLALQAHKLGLHAHGMGGFDREKAIEALGVPPDRFEIIAAFAVGRRGDPANLPEDLRQRELPSLRKPASEVAVEGRFPEGR